MFVLANMWFQTLMRQFFFNIDRVVFVLIPEMYEFLITIARTSILSQADIIDMATRVYRLLAVFMVFKVTFSLIMYVVNPDDFTDKSKGIGKLVTRIIISLSLLILTPYIFSYAFQLQTIILEDNSLSVLIFGDKNESATNSDFNRPGDTMAFIAISPFFTPNLGIEDLKDCVKLTIYDPASDSYTFNPDCKAALDAMSANNPNFTEDTKNTYIYGVEVGVFGPMFRQNMAIATDSNKEEFIMEYKYLFSTVMGVLIIVLLVNFCLDVALRSIKLAFLQLIAPIPILSYVDPKSGKDGMFKKWYDMCFKTYISLFIRLLAVYFATYIIARVGKMVDIVDGSYVTNGFVKILIVVGALMFAKQFPKILEGLGIKLDGGFTLNPLKKIENEMIGGKKTAAFIKSAPAAALAGGAAFGTNLIANKGNVFSAAAGGISATARGLKGAVKGEKFGKNFSNSYGGAMKARTNRADRRELGINAFDVASENIKAALHIPNEQQKQKVKVEHLNAFSNAGKAAKTRAEGEVDKKASQIYVDGQNLGALRDKYEILKSTEIKRSDYNSDADYERALNDQASKAAEAQANYFKARKKVVNAYYDHSDNLSQSSVSSGGSTVTGFDAAFGAAPHDEIVSSNKRKMKQLNKDYSMGLNTDSTDIGAVVQSAEDESARITNSKEYTKNELIAQQAQKEKAK